MSDFQDRLQRIQVAHETGEQVQRTDPAHLAELRRDLKARRRRIVNVASPILGAPLLLLYFLAGLDETIEPWAYSVGFMPGYGVMQFIASPGIIDRDSVLLSGLVGAAVMLVVSTVVWLIARIVIR